MDRNPKLQSERNPISKPRVFIWLEFGVSWSRRHTPSTHTITYTSRNLRNSRDKGHFPRQLPAPTTNFLAAPPEYHQHRARSHGGQPRGCQQDRQSQSPRRRPHSRENERTSEHAQDHTREQNPQHRQQRRESRSESRGVSYERGSSAPPPFHDSPWDAAPGPSASLFPSTEPTTQEQPRIWKPLPEPPSRFRLGEDGLPWSAWAWPMDQYEADEQEERGQEEPPYANQPTTVPISPEEGRGNDPDRIRELESLSAAMMTVDNGFENQWWHQGPREATDFWPRDQEESTRMSMNEALLLSAAESPVSASPEGWYAPRAYDESLGFEALVSSISTVSSPAETYIPLRRTLTTRSEDLFIGGA